MPSENQIQRYTNKSNARRALTKIGQPARDAHESLLREDHVGIYFVTADAEKVVRDAKKQAAPAAPRVTTVQPVNPVVVQGALEAIQEADVGKPPVFDPALAAAKVLKAKSEKAPRPAPVLVNGVRRPMKGKCADVWTELDKLNETAVPTIVEVKALNESKGWNINNTTIEFYAWRKFNGLNVKKGA